MEDRKGLVVKLPTLAELTNDDEMSLKDNAFMVLLNSAPPKNWVKVHPMAKTDYLPIERVEYLLSRIFTKWWVEIKNTQVIANSVVVTIRLYVVNPVTLKEEWQDGIGAMTIQTDKGAGAMDWNFAKADGVMKAAPSAETYAIKDAAEKFGKLFGKDLSRKEQIGYDDLLKSPKIDIEDLQFRFENIRDNLTPDEAIQIERILKNKEVQHYKKVHQIVYR